MVRVAVQAVRHLSTLEDKANALGGLDVSTLSRWVNDPVTTPRGRNRKILEHLIATGRLRLTDAGEGVLSAPPDPTRMGDIRGDRAATVDLPTELRLAARTLRREADTLDRLARAAESGPARESISDDDLDYAVEVAEHPEHVGPAEPREGNGPGS